MQHRRLRSGLGRCQASKQPFTRVDGIYMRRGARCRERRCRDGRSRSEIYEPTNAGVGLRKLRRLSGFPSEGRWRAAAASEWASFGRKPGRVGKGTVRAQLRCMSRDRLYLPDFVVGFQPSGRVESCCRGVGYPTARNGSISQYREVPATDELRR
jgi:hypothetical protein